MLYNQNFERQFHSSNFKREIQEQYKQIKGQKWKVFVMLLLSFLKRAKVMRANRVKKIISPVMTMVLKYRELGRKILIS